MRTVREEHEHGGAVGLWQGRAWQAGPLLPGVGGPRQPRSGLPVARRQHHGSEIGQARRHGLLDP